MSKKLTIQDVKDAIEMEGFGYALTDYVSAKRIEDVQLRNAWCAAQLAIEVVEKILKEHGAE